MINRTLKWHVRKGTHFKFYKVMVYPTFLYGSGNWVKEEKSVKFMQRKLGCNDHIRHNQFSKWANSVTIVECSSGLTSVNDTSYVRDLWDHWLSLGRGVGTCLAAWWRHHGGFPTWLHGRSGIPQMDILHAWIFLQSLLRAGMQKGLQIIDRCCPNSTKSGIFKILVWLRISNFMKIQTAEVYERS
jgi:hypothetical protein